MASNMKNRKSTKIMRHTRADRKFELEDARFLLKDAKMEVKDTEEMKWHY
jgi:hypothetical protein